MAYTPTCGPSRSIWMTPGSDRSFRDPSNTTMMSGRELHRPGGRRSQRPAACSLMMASSSAIRAATDSASLPISDDRSPVPGLAGSAAASGPTPSSACPQESVSTQICRSLGLCRVAAWATSQRPTARGASPGPATPSTPRCGSGTVTGASGICQKTCLRCSSCVGSAARPRTAGRPCPPAAAGSRGRCGAVPTAAAAGRRRCDSTVGRVGAVVPLLRPLGLERRAGVVLDAAPCAPGTRPACRRSVRGPAFALAHVVADHHDRAQRAHGQHVDLVQ